MKNLIFMVLKIMSLDYRLIQNNFKFFLVYPLVFHYDERNFEQYLNKIKFVGYEGVII